MSDSQLNSALDTINNASQYLSQTIEDFRTFLDPTNNKRSEFLITNTIENELIQVLINILNNAQDSLVNIEEKERFIFISSYKKGKELIIEIKDNAKGIRKEIIDRVFEPYFTTKHKSQGTGIGLYMCQEITIKHLNGSIEVENETYTYKDIEYTGAKFTIKIDIV